MAYVTKDMTFGELLMTYYDKCPKIVDDLMELGMALAFLEEHCEILVSADAVQKLAAV